MLKTANCIKMIKILSDGNIHSISEIASRLETKPRNIINYRDEIESAGYKIDTVAGRYGGYKIVEKTLFPCLRLTEEEKKALSAGVGYLKARNDFPQKREYVSAMEKVFCSENGDIEPYNPTVIPRFPLAMSESEIKKRYDVMESAVKKHDKVNIEYRSNDNIVRERTVHPYKLYMYNNGWFVLAFCETAKDFRYFKLNRIIKYTVLQDKFRRLLAYNEREWLDAFGMTNNGEWYDVKLKFTGKFAMVVQDYIYGKNQITECVDSNTTILTLQMQYKDTIVGFVLSHGIYCEVLEPEWLKNEVKSVAAEISMRYDS